MRWEQISLSISYVVDVVLVVVELRKLRAQS